MWRKFRFRNKQESASFILHERSQWLINQVLSTIFSNLRVLLSIFFFKHTHSQCYFLPNSCWNCLIFYCNCSQWLLLINFVLKIEITVWISKKLIIIPQITKNSRKNLWHLLYYFSCPIVLFFVIMINLKVLFFLN